MIYYESLLIETSKAVIVFRGISQTKHPLPRLADTSSLRRASGSRKLSVIRGRRRWKKSQLRDKLSMIRHLHIRARPQRNRT